jgi:hypothetical protein
MSFTEELVIAGFKKEPAVAVITVTVSNNPVLLWLSRCFGVLLTVTLWTELPVTALMFSGLAQRRELITFRNLFSWQPCFADPRS